MVPAINETNSTLAVNYFEKMLSFFLYQHSKLSLHFTFFRCAALCPRDWVHWNGHCWYSSSNDRLTFEAAEEACREVNGHASLASIHQQWDNRFLSGQTESELYFDQDAFCCLYRFEVNYFDVNFSLHVYKFYILRFIRF